MDSLMDYLHATLSYSGFSASFSSFWLFLSMSTWGFVNVKYYYVEYIEMTAKK